MPERPRLQASPRTVKGRAVKRLRQSGVIPANLVTPNQPSTAVQVDERALATLVRQGADGRLLDLECDGESEAVLFDDYELDIITDRLLHATFRRVDLTKPVTVEVAIELEGTAPAAAVMGVTVIQSLTSLQIAALPSEIRRGWWPISPASRSPATKSWWPTCGQRTACIRQWAMPPKP